MKILFIGDYSNFHVTLARELRVRGHEVTVASNGSSGMDTVRDIDISRRKGLAGSFAYLGRLFKLWSSFAGYDIVQLINPNFLDLRPGKIRYFFNELRKRNRCICLSLAGSDPVIVKGCVEDGLFRYSEFRIGDEKSPYARMTPGIERRWLNGTMGDHCRYIYENTQAAFSALYEYDLAARPYLGDKLVYTGIPIDLGKIKERPFAMPGDGKVNIMVGIKSDYEVFKGLDRLLACVREVERRHPDRCRVQVARDLPYEKYLSVLEDAHVVVDQLYSYSPGTNALETMAMGKISVSGGEPEYYDFIGEEHMHPIVNVVPDDERIISALESLILSETEMRERAAMGRRFVEKHNSAALVAERFLNKWESVMSR